MKEKRIIPKKVEEQLLKQPHMNIRTGETSARVVFAPMMKDQFSAYCQVERKGVQETIIFSAGNNNQVIDASIHYIFAGQLGKQDNLTVTKYEGNNV